MFRIFSLDGGGIKGAFSAAVLAALEHDTGKAAVDDFELIVGTSTGGSIAVGLGLGKTVQGIVEFSGEQPRQNGTSLSGNNSGSSGLGGSRKFFSFANKAPHLGLRSGRSAATASSVSAK